MNPIHMNTGFGDAVRFFSHRLNLLLYVHYRKKTPRAHPSPGEFRFILRIIFFLIRKVLFPYTKVGYLERDQLMLDGIGDGFRAAGDLQLREDTADVGFHSGNGDHQDICDLLVALALRNQIQHFHFSFS